MVASRWRTTGQVLFVAALGAATLAFLFHYSVRHASFDLKIYYYAVRYWLGGQGDLYSYHAPGGNLGFTYPPFAALAMLPMAGLPWPVARLVGKLASVAVAVALLVVYWFLDPVAQRQGWTRWFTWAVAAVLTGLFEPLREAISYGQVNMILLGLVLADSRIIVRGSRWGGVAVGIATAVKLTPGLFIGYLLIARRWRAAATATATLLGVTVLAAPDG